MADDDNEIKKSRLNRRSFMSRVAGGAVAVGAAAAITGGVAMAQNPNYTGRSDSDPTDPAGHGRTGVTDADGGPRADRAGYGRGTRRSGCSDSDPTDPGGNGRRCSGGRTGITDRDPTDPAGNGRGTVNRGNPNRTGRTDSDGGPNADRAGYGRTGITDRDSGAGADRAGYGRGNRPGQGQGCTDSDTGAGSDPVGRGRRCGGAGGNRGNPHYTGRTDSDPYDRAGHGRTGVTDSDGGPNADRAGYGRRTRRTCTDSDTGYGSDPVGRGRRC